MPTNAFRTWQNRIDSGVFTKAQCNQFAAAVSRLAMELEPRGRRTSLTLDEARNLRTLLRERGGVALTPSHRAQGYEWLRNNYHRLNIPSEVVENFSHFTFQGDLQRVGPHLSYPMWRVHMIDGRAIDYYYSPWQAFGEGGWRWAESPSELARCEITGSEVQ